MITVALLGGGFMGSVHAASYQALGDRVRVKSVYARGSERSRKLTDALEARFIDDLDEAVADPEVDVVDVCLPTYLHQEAAIKALTAEKNVFIEKPIALTLEDADAIVAAARESGCMLMIGMILRFWPEYVELRQLVNGGELGRLLGVSTHRLSPAVDWNEWMTDESSSGGVAVDLLIHDLDQMNWLLGSPKSVLARSSSPGHIVAMVEYEGGSYGFAEASLTMPASYPFSSNIRVLCEHGAAEYAFAAGPAAEGGNIGGAYSVRGLHVYPESSGSRTVRTEGADPWMREIAYFVECIEQGRRPVQGTGEQARAALGVSLAAKRSLESKKAELV